MNVLILISGLLAAGVLLGHSILGRRMYFLPMIEADFDPYARRIMEFVWHMSTVALSLMTLALLAIGLGRAGEGAELLGWFIFAHFLLWGLLHLLLGATSGLERAVFRLFQWTFFLAVAATCGAGLLTA